MEQPGELFLSPYAGVVDCHHSQTAEVTDDDHEPGPGSRGLRRDLDTTVVARVLYVPLGRAHAREGIVKPVHKPTETALGLRVVIACRELQVRDLSSSHSRSPSMNTRVILPHRSRPELVRKFSTRAANTKVIASYCSANPKLNPSQVPVCRAAASWIDDEIRRLPRRR
jgi:hypothetical protein